jgi:hypothetical protein
MKINQHSEEFQQKQLLEKSLGVPFFDSLMACAKLRIQNLTDVFAAAYVLTLLMGIKNRHSWIGENTFTLTYCDICGSRLNRIRDAAKRLDDFFTVSTNTSTIRKYVIEDLLTASGRLEAAYHPETDSQLLNHDDLLLLSQIADFGGTSFGDIANLLNNN